MSTLRRLVHEIHRRSIWQVLSIYLVGSWGALQVVDGVHENAGLPDWVPPFALVLLVIGLPVVLATAFVQEGMPGRGDGDQGEPSPEAGRAAAEPDEGAKTPSQPAPMASPAPTGTGLFTWRNAIGGGVAAFLLLGVAVAGYFVMRATGVGPVASLAAQGVFEDREPLVLSDFASPAASPELGSLVTEALRVDLVESTALTVLPESYVSDAMSRMGLADSVFLTPELAREIAQRDGFKAYIQGEVGALGGGYVLTASLVEARSGEPLAAFRETVEGESGLLAAIDKLSERIREKAGESLRQIRAGGSLEAVTTGSLEALKAYTEAVALSSRGQEVQAIALLESALELDPDFGMAWRKLAALVGNQGVDPQRRREAATRAYELREGMTESERWLAEAYYFGYVDIQPQRAIQAYEQVLAVSPDDPTALNNLAILLYDDGPERAISLLERAVQGPGATAVAHQNLTRYYWDFRRDEEARALLARGLERYPGQAALSALVSSEKTLTGDFRGAHDDRAAVAAAETAPGRRQDILKQMAAEDLGMGKLREARAHLDDVARIAAVEESESWVVGAEGVWIYAMALMPVGDTRRAEALRFMARPGTMEALVQTAPDPWFAANHIGSRALAGDLAGARADRDAWERLVPPPSRGSTFETGWTWVGWGLAVASGDGETAVSAADRILDEHLRCGDRRCWGWWEKGRALEAAGRNDEARAMYRRHLEGLAFTETRWFPPTSVDALWRLARLAEEAGDAQAAAEAYARFAELWADADAELQPVVRQALAKAEALGG